MVGGGNTAVEEALFLTNFAAQGDGRPSPRPLPRRADPAGPAVQASEDRGGLGQRHRRDARHDRPARASPRVRLKNVKTGAVTELKVDGVFIAIGHAPATELVQGPARDEAERLIAHRAGLDRDHSARRVRRRRRHRRNLPAGGHGRRHGLHGGARGRAVSRSAGARRAAAE